MLAADKMQGPNILFSKIAAAGVQSLGSCSAIRAVVAGQVVAAGLVQCKAVQPPACA